MPKGVIGELHGKSTFSFDRNSQNPSQRGYTILHSRPQVMCDLVSLHSHQQLMLLLFFMLAILIDGSL